MTQLAVLTPMIVFVLITVWGVIEMRDAKRFDTYVISVIVLFTGVFGVTASVVTGLVIYLVYLF